MKEKGYGQNINNDIVLSIFTGSEICSIGFHRVEKGIYKEEGIKGEDLDQGLTLKFRWGWYGCLGKIYMEEGLLTYLKRKYEI